jgi:hypothetical protein
MATSESGSSSNSHSKPEHKNIRVAAWGGEEHHSAERTDQTDETCSDGDSLPDSNSKVPPLSWSADNSARSIRGRDQRRVHLSGVVSGHSRIEFVGVHVGGNVCRLVGGFVGDFVS